MLTEYQLPSDLRKPSCRLGRPGESVSSRASTAWVSQETVLLRVKADLREFLRIDNATATKCI